MGEHTRIGKVFLLTTISKNNAKNLSQTGRYFYYNR